MEKRARICWLLAGQVVIGEPQDGALVLHC